MLGGRKKDFSYLMKKVWKGNWNVSALLNEDG